MCLFVNLSYVFKSVKSGETEVLKFSDAVFAVLIGIELRDQRDPYQASSGQALRREKLQIFNDLSVVKARICLVDLRIHVLYVDDKLVYDFHEPADMFLRHIQRRLDIYLPRLWSDLPEGTYEPASQRRLTSSECDSSSRRLEIQVIHTDLIQKLLRGHGKEFRPFTPCLRIEAPAASERA